jgi:hypothetical protein
MSSHYCKLVDTFHIANDCMTAMGVRMGGKGALAHPPWPAKNIMFLDFFEKNNMFLLFLKQKVCSCPPSRVSP